VAAAAPDASAEAARGDNGEPALLLPVAASPPPPPPDKLERRLDGPGGQVGYVWLKSSLPLAADVGSEIELHRRRARRLSGAAGGGIAMLDGIGPLPTRLCTAAAADSADGDNDIDTGNDAVRVRTNADTAAGGDDACA
jgi:hypothetical protein